MKRRRRRRTVSPGHNAYVRLCELRECGRVCICNCIKCIGYGGWCERPTAKISEKYAYRLELFYNSSLIEMFRVHFLRSHFLSFLVSVFLVGWSFAVGTMYAWVGQHLSRPCIPNVSILFALFFDFCAEICAAISFGYVHIAHTHTHTHSGGRASENFCLIL